MQLAGGDLLLGTVGDAVDHLRAGAADPLAAVVVEDDRLFAALDQVLVDFVEHLEKRHVGADVLRLVLLESPLVLGVLLTPYRITSYNVCYTKLLRVWLLMSGP